VTTTPEAVLPMHSTSYGVACRDEAGGRRRVTDVLAAKTTTYCYEPAGRLRTAATGGGPTYSYGFDAATNRTAGPEGTHTVNVVDQLTDTGFDYDLDGNLTVGGSLSGLAYNGISQTTSITAGANTTDYACAGAGQAERTTTDPANAGPTTALHGILGLVSETTGGASTYYTRDAGGSLIAERTPVGDFYYVYDGQGSVIALVEPNGTQRAAYTYDPYGGHATATAMNGALPPNPWRWSGSYLDATGLYKMGARYYDPTLGRFTQVDPVEGGSCNNYDYGCGDPVNNDDLDGTRCLTGVARRVQEQGHTREICRSVARGAKRARAAFDFQTYWATCMRGAATGSGLRHVRRWRRWRGCKCFSGCMSNIAAQAFIDGGVKKEYVNWIHGGLTSYSEAARFARGTTQIVEFRGRFYP
jgi:RHS repeat-associated protein